MDLNSMSPSTAKWLYASGSRNSLNVDLKNSLYASASTSRGERTQMGLSLFVTTNSWTSSYSVFITGSGAASVNSSPLASASIFFLLYSSAALAVASTSSTCFGTDLVANTSMGKEINSEYVLTRFVSLASSANSSAPSLRLNKILVPRAGAASASVASRME